MKTIVAIALILSVIFVAALLLLIWTDAFVKYVGEEKDRELIEFTAELKSMNVGNTKEFSDSQHVEKMTEVFLVGLELGRTYSAETERRVFRRVLIIKRTR